MGIKTLNYAFAQQDFEKPVYLAPNSQSLQKTYRGAIRNGAFHNQKQPQSML